MKKMKEKYKDQVQLNLISHSFKQECLQDDEERELRMKLLQSSGSQDDEAKSRKKKKENRGLEKLYGKAGTGWSLKYEQQFESSLLQQEATS